MKFLGLFAGAAALALLPAVSAAQDTTVTTTTIQTTTTQDTWTVSDRTSNWIGSVFVGSNFGQDADRASVDFGASLGYMWNGAIGAEFQANFAPDFQLEPGRSALLFGDRPWINSYMLNAIAGIPIGGRDARFQPYVSGGVGALTLRSNVLQANDGTDIRPDDSRLGGNVGVGVMGFGRTVGLRADVRYFTGFGNNLITDFDTIDSPTEGVGNQILSNLNFWRANVGLAFRW